MIKKFMYILIFYFFIFNISFANDKVAVINISKILQHFPKKDEIENRIVDEFKERAKMLQENEHYLSKRIEIFQRDHLKMKSHEKYKAEKDINMYREQFSKIAQNFEQDNHRRHSEERNKMLFLIQETIKKISKKYNYNVVLDYNIIAYIAKERDITMMVLKDIEENKKT